VYSALLKMGRSGTEEQLVTALMRFGWVEMAEDYLNSGNPRLEDAARQWASENGYTISKLPAGGPGPSWGEGFEF